MDSDSNFDKFGAQIIYYKSSEDMKELKDSSIDLIVTSPPYNRSKTYSDDEGNVYNDQKTELEYEALLLQVWSECFRVLSSKGMFFLNIGDSASNQGFSNKIAELVTRSGFIRLQTIIWLKSFLGRGHYTPSGRSRRLNNIFEYIFVFVKDQKNYQMIPQAIGIPYADKSNIGRYAKSDLRDAGNVWFIPYSRTTGSTIKKGHEAPFPIELPYRCIKLTGATSILDPFAGTGSTLAAARILNIKGVGYEKFPRREVIQQRISEHQFFPPPVNLLPHLEQTIRKYVELSHTLTFADLLYRKMFSFTKKEFNEIRIVQDVLDKLRQDTTLFTDYLTYYDTQIEKSDHTDKRIELTEFFDKPDK
ncbi:MAG: DNA-methyltransferase [Candidatus Hodarchaeales archaeon]|jgi:site-specific DNA-methyltransferase (adenine-specific)